MKRIRWIVIFGLLLLATPVMQAQDFLKKAKNYLDAGECEKARMAYDAYKVENPSGNAVVERRIKECESQRSGSQTSATKLPKVQKPIDGQPCSNAATVTDIDGNTYNTVQIGKQCWMRENLRTTRYANGESIPLGTNTSTTTSYRYAPNDNSSNVSTLGYLYSWSAVMHGARGGRTNPSGVQGICPKGWHVPSDAEWTALTNYVSSWSGYVCGNDKKFIAKALTSTEGWKNNDGDCVVGNNPSANNATGFSALSAGGYYGDYLDYSISGDYANFWSATEYNKRYAYYRSLSYRKADVYRYYVDKSYGYSVRCLRD